MIVDLPSTTTATVAKRLVTLRNDTGAMALGRVLTLIIVTGERDCDEAIEAATSASRQHPCRIIVLVAGNKRGSSRLDAQIRLGGDAGASEIVVLRLYGALASHGDSVLVPLLLPDSPVVAWWPHTAPADAAKDPVGAMAQRRITDSAEARNPHQELRRRASTYAPGDTDLAWSRITMWRGLLAAAIDQPPYEPVLSATVSGGADSPSTDLLAAWLAQTLKCPVIRARTRQGTGMISVRLERRTGDIDLVRPDGAVATLTQFGQPVRRIGMPRRLTADALADELRRLDPDEVYAEALTKGLAKLGERRAKTEAQAVADGQAPSTKEAAKEVRRIARANAKLTSSSMVSREHPDDSSVPTEVVKQASARKLAAVRSDKETSPPRTRAPRKTAPRKTAAAGSTGARTTKRTSSEESGDDTTAPSRPRRRKSQAGG